MADMNGGKAAIRDIKNVYLEQQSDKEVLLLSQFLYTK